MNQSTKTLYLEHFQQSNKIICLKLKGKEKVYGLNRNHRTLATASLYSQVI